MDAVTPCGLLGASGPTDVNFDTLDFGAAKCAVLFEAGVGPIAGVNEQGSQQYCTGDEDDQGENAAHLVGKVVEFVDKVFFVE